MTFVSLGSSSEQDTAYPAGSPYTCCGDRHRLMKV
jgi:hypothetical protein